MSLRMQPRVREPIFATPWKGGGIGRTRGGCFLPRHLRGAETYDLHITLGCARNLACPRLPSLAPPELKLPSSFSISIRILRIDTRAGSNHVRAPVDTNAPTPLNRPVSPYTIVRLKNDAFSVRSEEHAETFHPVVGPIAEAEALYVHQLRIADRVASHVGPFVVWDVGLGAAANALSVLRSVKHLPASIRMISFDCTLEPLKFALQHVDQLQYLSGYEPWLEELTLNCSVHATNSPLEVDWSVRLSDFPELIATAAPDSLPAPNAILFDAFSPAKNPAMWTHEVFRQLHHRLHPETPCALATYSRSTLLRVTLLLAGFFVGSGSATGEKEETTIAANTLDLIDAPLDGAWLKRARRSTSAEPLWSQHYRQAPLSDRSWDQLLNHPQFA